MNPKQIDNMIDGKEPGLREEKKNKALENIDELIKKGVITGEGRERLVGGLK